MKTPPVDDNPKHHLGPETVVDDVPLTERAALRREMRQRRRALGVMAQRRASENLARLLMRQPVFRRSRNIAFYWAADGEIDPALAMLQAQAMGKNCFLPVLSSFQEKTLVFRSYRGGMPLQRNRYGIPEPRGTNLKPRDLDLVLLPLVAFDDAGNRLGMGGGFYDRSFAFKRREPASRPLLVGLAHSCQQLPRLDHASWDVPLDAVLTAEKVVVAKRGAREFIASDCRGPVVADWGQE